MKDDPVNLLSTYETMTLINPVGASFILNNPFCIQAHFPVPLCTACACAPTTCIHTYIQTYIHTYTHTYIHRYIQT